MKRSVNDLFLELIEGAAPPLPPCGSLVSLNLRYELPQPAAAQRNDLGAWQESVDNSMAQLEHQAGR